MARVRSGRPTSSRRYWGRIQLHVGLPDEPSEKLRMDVSTSASDISVGAVSGELGVITFFLFRSAHNFRLVFLFIMYLHDEHRRVVPNNNIATEGLVKGPYKIAV